MFYCKFQLWNEPTFLYLEVHPFTFVVGGDSQNCTGHYQHRNEAIKMTLDRVHITDSKLFFIFWVGLTILPHVQGLLPPTGAHIESYDLDFNLTWDPPADATSGEDVTYTVLYAERTSIYLSESLWVEVRDCVNISSTYCNVSVVIDRFPDFSIKSVLQILADENDVTSEPLQVDLFPGRNVHLSAPTIDVKEVMDTFLGLQILGPITPYLDAEATRRLRVEEFAPLLKDQILYSILLKGETMEKSVNTSAKYPYVEFNDLAPGSNYTISAITVYLGLFKTTVSEQPSLTKLSTTLNDNSYKPLDVELREKSIDCNFPDLRDVEVTWKRPVAFEPILFFDLQYWIHGDELVGMSSVVQREINRTFYSFLLRHLPRWSLIKITVFANTSVTGCPSFEHALFPHVVDSDSSRPENLSFQKDASNGWRFFWDTPSSCKECIAGYEISWESTSDQESKNASRDTVPPEELNYLIETDSDVTMVTVTTLLKSGTYMTKTGQQAVLGIQYQESADIFKMATIFLATLLVSMLLLLVLFYKLRSKRKWKDSPSIKEMFSSKDTDSGTQLFPTYPSTPAVREYSRSIYVKEPEVFDELLPVQTKEKGSAIPLRTRSDQQEMRNTSESREPR